MEQQNKRGERNKTGALGEEIATKYLQKLSFTVIQRNYLKKWGEIDIVARGTDGKVHFVEVKTVSYETKDDLNKAISSGTWRPEENVHYSKIKRLTKAIESWISEKKYAGNWQIDVLAIRVVPREKYASVKYLSNVY